MFSMLTRSVRSFSRGSSRVTALGAVVLGLCLAAGCGTQKVGDQIEVGDKGVKVQSNGGSLTLDDKRDVWNLTGRGPKTYTETDDTGTRSMTDAIQRSITLHLPNKTKVGVTAGTDIGAEKIRATIPGADGQPNVLFEVDGFRTSASAPTDAYAGLYEASREEMLALPPAQLQARIEELKTIRESIKDAIPSLASVLTRLIESFAVPGG